ncbi:MAG TPA: hypothetical protein VL625_11055 [Patescibacteria group bacterium]|nr:hypothetical protein [Patescibacteria group bacterium]
MFRPFKAALAAGALSTVFILAGCGDGSSPDHPRTPDTTDQYDAAITTAVQANLKTLHLNEDDLAPGYTIPWASGDHWGTAAASGRKGPGGHEIYDVKVFEDGYSSGVFYHTSTLEIPPPQ